MLRGVAVVVVVDVGADVVDVDLVDEEVVEVVLFSKCPANPVPQRLLSWTLLWMIYKTI